MSEVNYAAMSDAELKQYFREHHSEEALQSYLDRLNQRPKRVIATADDPDFDRKIEAEIRRRLDAKITQNTPIPQD
jgi:predicted metal-dependent RNase